MGAQSSLLTLVGATSVGANKIAESASRLSSKDSEASQSAGNKQNKSKIAQSVDGKLAQQKFSEAMQNLQGNIESIYSNPGFTPRQKKWRATHERNKAAKSFAEFVNGGNE